MPLFVQLTWDESPDFLLQDLPGLILKNALGAGIPRGHAILTVHRDDGISGAVDETFEIALGFLDLSIELRVLYGKADVIEEHAEQLDLKLGDRSLMGVAHQLDEPNGGPLQDDGGEDHIPVWGTFHLQFTGRAPVGISRLPTVLRPATIGLMKLRTVSPVEPDIEPPIAKARLELISNGFQRFSEIELADNDPGDLPQDAQLRHALSLLCSFLFRGRVTLMRVNRERHQLGDRPSDIRPIPPKFARSLIEKRQYPHFFVASEHGEKSPPAVLERV